MITKDIILFPIIIGAKPIKLGKAGRLDISDKVVKSIQFRIGHFFDSKTICKHLDEMNTELGERYHWTKK